MFSQIKLYLIAGLGILASVFAALFYRKSAQFESAKLDGVEKARETENKATDAMVDGLKNEQEEINEAANSTKRDGFS